MSNAVVKTHNLTKIFKDFWGRNKVKALDKLSIEINRGEVFGLLGPNGSGKSTTLKLMLGLLFPTKGKVSIFGKPVNNTAIKEKIGFLPEESYLYGYLTAKETLFFYGNLFDISRNQIKKRTPQLLEMVGLGKVGSRPVREFSKGMTRRLGLAQALINDPELIFLDEPTSGLDPIGTKQIKNLITEMKNRGKTILLCSHLLADVEDVCDRIAILYGGKIRVMGKVDELLSKHDSLQLNLPELKPETLKQIKCLIEKTENASNITVEHPKDRLEKFFLKVIEQAVVDKSETAGANVLATEKEIPEIPETTEHNSKTNKKIINDLLNKEN
ncbi:ABC transporter ATP-binding protein [bacterium]|nr:ABC transporter ATP-binding protein [bacterium]